MVDCLTFSSFASIFEISIALNLGFAAFKDIIFGSKIALERKLASLEDIARLSSGRLGEERVADIMSDLQLTRQSIYLQDQELNATRIGLSVAGILVATFTLGLLIFAGFDVNCYPTASLLFPLLIAIGSPPALLLVMWLKTNARYRWVRESLDGLDRRVLPRPENR